MGFAAAGLSFCAFILYCVAIAGVSDMETALKQVPWAVEDVDNGPKVYFNLRYYFVDVDGWDPKKYDWGDCEDDMDTNTAMTGLALISAFIAMCGNAAFGATGSSP